MARLFPKLTVTPLQATTYLLGIALFSISFLVFLNSSISFVVTDVIGQKKDVGNAVGTLGFADELLALVACPLWGLLSDKIGVRTVAVLGYCIVGLSLVCLVQSTNVYPELLLGRLGFSIGGAACSTMVTAILPAMVAKKDEKKAAGETGANGHTQGPQEVERPSRNDSIGHRAAPSVSSEVTITPTRYSSRGRRDEGTDSSDRKADPTAGTSQLAGFVGLFTGVGALVALAIFLPLPAYLQENGETPAKSVQNSFYIVAAIAFCVAIFIFFGLRRLPGEEGKGLGALLHGIHPPSPKSDQEADTRTRRDITPSYLALVSESMKLGLTDPSISIAYFGGFVARASSVGISLFIPLFVNAYFVRTGLCTSNPDNLADIKENCQRAYKLAAALTGIAETAALIAAPLFGWLGGLVANGRAEWPLMGAAAVGILGYVGFGLLKNPDAFHGEDDSRWAFLAVVAIGISQIGAIVCSLAVLGRGVNAGTAPEAITEARAASPEAVRREDVGPIEGAEIAPLLPSDNIRIDRGDRDKLDRSQLKGSIAGTYSLAGGAGILLLTKLGGTLFDSWTPGAPFFMLAAFNAILLVGVALIGGGSAMWKGRLNPVTMIRRLLRR